MEFDTAYFTVQALGLFGVGAMCGGIAIGFWRHSGVYHITDAKIAQLQARISTVAPSVLVTNYLDDYYDRNGK